VKKGFRVIEQETLAQFVRRVPQEKGLRFADVQQRAGGAISKGYVCDICNGLDASLTVKKLQALARGLDVPEDAVFAVARGVPAAQRELDTSRFALMFYRYQRLSEKDRQAIDSLLDMVDREIEWRRKQEIERQSLAAAVIAMPPPAESRRICG
jgi:transcriptional regulator with XRE-family HTH domain